MEDGMKIATTGARYSNGVRARTARTVFKHQHDYGMQVTAIRSIAAKMGMPRETLRKCVDQARTRPQATPANWRGSES
jgi:transposase